MDEKEYVWIAEPSAGSEEAPMGGGFTCEDARDALLGALPAPDRRGDGEIDLDDGWVVTADRFGGGPGLTVTAPNGERFVVVVFREGDA